MVVKFTAVIDKWCVVLYSILLSHAYFYSRDILHQCVILERLSDGIYKTILLTFHKNVNSNSLNILFMNTNCKVSFNIWYPPEGSHL